MRTRHVLARLAQAILVLVILSFIVFTLLYLAPGDVAKTLIGTRKPTAEAIAAINTKYHLDEPFLDQYWHWAASFLSGDLGQSIRSSLPVVDVVGERVGLTVALVGMGFSLAVFIGLPLGVIAAARRGTSLDRTVVAGAVVGVSAPPFALALVLLYVFSVMLRWFPVYGVGNGFFGVLWHLALPAVALSAGIAAMIVKITRTAVSRELEQDYVAFARSRGLPRLRISGLIAKNAAIPIVTSAGLILATLFGATVFIETTFALPGIGQLLADAITFKDVPVVQAITMLVAIIIVATMFLVDVLILWLRPGISTPGHLARRGGDVKQLEVAA